MSVCTTRSNPIHTSATISYVIPIFRCTRWFIISIQVPHTNIQYYKHQASQEFKHAHPFDVAACDNEEMKERGDDEEEVETEWRWTSLWEADIGDD